MQLLKRMDQRQYPESMQVLALYWLKTVWSKGYTRDDWNALAKLLQQNLLDETDPGRRQAFLDLSAWISEDSVRDGHDTYERRESARQPASHDALRAWVVRLVNEWLPAEIARLLVEEPESGIPALAVARALERLVIREGLTDENLEALLEPGFMSPRIMYPADYEVLCDVVLYLLGRLDAPPRPVLPAALLFISPGVHLSRDYAHAVERAQLFRGQQGDELHVPIDLAQAMEALSTDELHISSRVVTMDGRWWQAGKLRGGIGQNSIVYRPAGRVRIDSSHDHARIRVLWPQTIQHWSGPMHFDPVMHVFGREWGIGRWEQDAEHTWVDLEFTRWLRPEEMNLEAQLPHQQPAEVDLAWAALQNALESNAIAKLRRRELVPLGQALHALMEAANDARLRNAAAIEDRVNTVGNAAAPLREFYGPVRWSVLPESTRSVLTRPHFYKAISRELHDVFEGVPKPRHALFTWPNIGQWLRRLTAGQVTAR